MKKEGIKLGGLFVGMMGGEGAKQRYGKSPVERAAGRRGAISGVAGKRREGEDRGKEVEAREGDGESGSKEVKDREGDGEYVGDEGLQQETEGDGLDHNEVAQKGREDGEVDGDVDREGEVENFVKVKKEKVDDWFGDEW